MHPFSLFVRCNIQSFVEHCYISYLLDYSTEREQYYSTWLNTLLNTTITTIASFDFIIVLVFNNVFTMIAIIIVYRFLGVSLRFQVLMP